MKLGYAIKLSKAIVGRIDGLGDGAEILALDLAIQKAIEFRGTIVVERQDSIRTSVVAKINLGYGLADYVDED